MYYQQSGRKINLFKYLLVHVVAYDLGKASTSQQSRISQYIRTSVMSRNSRFNQWECVFWLECCVSQQPKRFKMADKGSRKYFPMPWMRAFRKFTFISNWVKYCPNYKIKGKFVLAFHVTDNSPQITIILGAKEALRTQCGPCLTSCCYHSLERDHTIGKHL